MNGALATAGPVMSVGSFGRLGVHARVLIGGAALLAVAGSVAGAGDPREAKDVLSLLAFAAIAMAAERLDINLYGESRVSLSGLFLLTAAIVLGPSAVPIMGCAVALAGHAGRGRPFYKLVYNGSVFVLASLASAYVYHGVVAFLPLHEAMRAPAAIAAALSDFAINTMMISLIIAATSRGETPLAVWREKFAWLFPHYVVFGFLALVLSLGYESFGVVGVLAFVLPVLMSRFTLKQYVDRTDKTVRDLRASHEKVRELSVELREAYGETLEAFVAALDTRDTETHGHSERVAEMSARIGEALGIKQGTREWLDLRYGAMLHDVGKIGVPDAVLRKPGALDDDEWTLIRQHPQLGFNMLTRVGFLQTAAQLVLCHHERFDGKGYPRRLAGDEIPLPARIFAVADTFDAITSVRPYKLARSAENACAEIAKNSGTQFDPRVVEAFLRLQHYRAERAA